MKTRTLISILILVLAVMIIAGSCATKRKVVSGVSAEGTDFTFVGISDTHINSENELDMLRDFLYTVQQTESPDMVIILEHQKQPSGTGC